MRLAYTHHKNRASNVPVTIGHIGGESVVKVDEREAPQIDGLFEYLGSYEFADEAVVTISNKDVDGYVVIDGVQFLLVDE